MIHFQNIQVNIIAFSHEMKNKNIFSKQQSNTSISLTFVFSKNIFNDVFDMENFDFLHIWTWGGKAYAECDINYDIDCDTQLMSKTIHTLPSGHSIKSRIVCFSVFAYKTRWLTHDLKWTPKQWFKK